MATLKYYLDTRATKAGEPSPIRLAIRIYNTSAFLTTDIRVLPFRVECRAGKGGGAPPPSILQRLLGAVSHASAQFHV